MNGDKGLFILSLSVVLIFMTSCGQEGGLTTSSDSGGGGSSSDSVSLTGTVTTPRTTSKSVTIGQASKGSEDSSSSLSLSKSAVSSEAEEEASPVKVIVTKAVTNELPDKGKVKVQKLDGTVLDQGEVQNGALQGININVNDLDSTKAVEIVVEAGGKKVAQVVDLSGAKNGGTKSTGETNATTTIADTLMQTSVDANANPDNKTGNLKSAVGDGTLKVEVAKTIEKQLGLSSTAGSDNAQNALAAIKKAVVAGMAEGKVTKFDEIASALQGGSILSTLKGLDSDLASVDLSTAASVASTTGGSLLNYFKDSTTAAKWKGDAALEALAKNTAVYDLNELKNMKDNPGNYQGVFNKYADAGSFDKMKQGAKAFAEYFEKFGSTAMTSGQFTAAKALFDNLTYSGSNLDKLGASVFAQIKAANTTAELNSLVNNPSQYCNTILKDPSALASDDGTIAQRWINHIETGGSFGTPCTSDTNCPSGQTCSTLTKFCGTSVAGTGTGTGGIGAGCSQNSDCASNSCVGGFCDAGTIGLKLFGGTCTTTADCVNGMTCSSGTCGFGGGGSNLANGATCTLNDNCTSTFCGGPSDARVCVALGGGTVGHICTANNQCASSNCSSTCRNVYTYPTAAGDSTCEGITSVTLTQTTTTAGTVQHNSGAQNNATITGSNISYTASGFNFTGTFSSSDFNVAVSGGCRIHFTSP